MPSKSGKQHRLMAMVANDPAASKRLGIPQSVGEDFMQADKGRKFGSGGVRPEKQKVNRPVANHGGQKLFAEGGKVKESKAMEQEHARTLSRIAKQEAAEAAKMACGGKVKKMASGGKVPPFVGKESKGEEKKEKKLPPWLYKKGEKAEGEKKFARGGSVDGCVTKGRTKGKVC